MPTSKSTQYQTILDALRTSDPTRDWPLVGPKPKQLQWFINALKTHDSDECLMWPFHINPRGYGSLTCACNTVMVHRLSFYVTHGFWPEPIARHTCDNPPCFNPHHILAGTNADNVADMIARGRYKATIGERNGCAKLTETEVYQIRQQYQQGVTQEVLTHKFNVSDGQISMIVNRKRWKHLP